MATAVTNIDCGAFFESVGRSSTRVLALDYDSTIAPFFGARKQGASSTCIRELLDSIGGMCRTRLVLLSTRPAREIRSLLRLDPSPEIWGAHGLERLLSNGRRQGSEVSDDALTALSDAESLVRDLGLEALMEVAPAGVAVHWKRGKCAKHEIERLHSSFVDLARTSGLILAEFDDGLEIRVRQPTTADLVRTILSEAEITTPVTYIGSDPEDEAAFLALNARGLTVLASSRHRRTAAKMWLKPPEELARFLTAWIVACGGGK